eukprot:TRINITY_DN11332_c0_g1_i1.p1 TRINITY_DN11332_c0_g1~~TRINITY_DN11332_c0_g1_i1.p1  ORF type:complete len:375 (+),score=107.05 TRINITY_DN11332_c0_g1_i1:74-1198(+)
MSVKLPSSVRGMTKWNPDLLKSVFSIPSFTLPASQIPEVIQGIKPHLLKRPNFKPILPIEGELRTLYVDPDHLQEAKSIVSYKKANIEWKNEEITLEAENWRPDEILDAILPSGEEGLSSFSTIGHIAHVNLRDHLLPYKSIIGEVLLRHKHIRTVVRKIESIDNTFRNFAMEVIGGTQDDFEVLVKESGVKFKFDFSRVYWNPRLSSEHDRIAEMITPGDRVLDIFAGVGPFVIPIGAKKRPGLILANDLNPDSFKYLKINKELNRIKGDFRTYNLDGREFIRTVVMDEILSQKNTRIHILMNLPAIAIEFLDAFPSLLHSENNEALPEIQTHVYCFSNAEDRHTDVKLRVQAVLPALPLDSISVHSTKCFSE